jgi:hypothetical protein
MVYVMAWVLALVYVPFARTSLDRMAASATGRGVAAMRPLTVSIFVVILVVTVAITYWVARRTRTASEFCRTRRKEH